MAEAAGLVLAAIPLLVSAVEHYEECFRILGCMKQFKHEYRKCRNRVKSIELQYDLTLDKLFLDVVDSEEELKRLKACPDHEAWVDVEARLSERLLPKVQRSYVDIMRDLQETMEELAQELGVDKSDFQERMGQVAKASQVPSQSHRKSKWLVVTTLTKESKGRVSYEAQRAKFSQGKHARDGLFGQIEGYIRSLDDLMNKNDDVAKILQNRQRPGLVPKHLLGFWRHARNVYSLLIQALTCPCKAEHCADLLLTRRETTEVLFNICLRYRSCHEQPAQSPWVCHRTVVAEYNRPRQPQISPIAPAALKSTAHVSGVRADSAEQRVRDQGNTLLPMRSAMRGASKTSRITHVVAASAPSVSFAVSPPPASLGGASRRTATANTIQPLPTQLAIIDNLCQAISRHADTQPCSGLLAAHGIDEEYSLTTPADGPDLAAKLSMTSLTTPLSDTDRKPDRARRFGTALTIASSHLQLHSSSWLGRRWSGDDILFETDHGSPILANPHLRATFAQQEGASQPARPADESFTSLGILLLELCFGLPFANSPVRGKYRAPDGRPQYSMDLAAALEWADMVEGEAGPDFADAVAWCLTTRRVKPHDETWRQEFSQNVVEPLKASYQSLTGTK